jgi:hypothetical protein
MVSVAVACLPAAVSLLLLAGVIYVDLRGELTTHLSLQALVTQSSPVHKPLLQVPLSKHTGGGDTASAVSGLHGCLQLMWEVGLPHSPVQFSSHCHFYKLSRSWLLGVCPCFLWPGLFIYSSGKDSLPPIFGTQCTPPSFPCVFIVLIAYYSVSLFSPGGGLSVQGAMLIWPRVVCGSTAVLWSSPCVRIPKPSGHRWLAAWGLSWYLCLTWSRDSLHWLEVWRCQSLASSWWFCLQGVSPASRQDFIIGGTLSASSL